MDGEERRWTERRWGESRGEEMRWRESRLVVGYADIYE
jgi:hypothetical protein